MPLRINTNTVYAANLAADNGPLQPSSVRPVRIVEIGQGALWTADPTRPDGLVRSPRARQCWENSLFGTVGHLAVFGLTGDQSAADRLAALKMRRLPSGGEALRTALADWDEQELSPNGLGLIIVHTSRQLMTNWENHLAQQAGVGA